MVTTAPEMPFRYVVFTALPYTLAGSTEPPALGTPDPGKPPVGYPTGDSSDYYITSITVGWEHLRRL